MDLYRRERGTKERKGQCIALKLKEWSRLLLLARELQGDIMTSERYYYYRLGDMIYANVENLHGVASVSVRRWYAMGDNLKPSRVGITLSGRELRRICRLTRLMELHPTP